MFYHVHLTWARFKPLLFHFHWWCLYNQISVKGFNDCCLTIGELFYQQYHGENKFHFDETKMSDLILYQRTNSLKQQSVIRHVAPHGHIILIPSESVFAIIPYSCVLSEEAANTNFIVFSLTVSSTVSMVSTVSLTVPMWFVLLITTLLTKCTDITENKLRSWWGFVWIIGVCRHLLWGETKIPHWPVKPPTPSTCIESFTIIVISFLIVEYWILIFVFFFVPIKPQHVAHNERHK